jgi:hypothetical protein
MAKAALRTNTLRLDQDQIATVRPPRESWRLDDEPADLGVEPMPASLWQLAHDVILAEADEALWGTRR